MPTSSNETPSLAELVYHANIRPTPGVSELSSQIASGHGLRILGEREDIPEADISLSGEGVECFDKALSSCSYFLDIPFWADKDHISSFGGSTFGEHDDTARSRR